MTRHHFHYLAGKVVVLQALGRALLQLAHPRGLLQLLTEDLVELHPPPLGEPSLHPGRRLLVSDQQGSLEPPLGQLVQLLQQDTAAEDLLEVTTQERGMVSSRLDSTD